MSDLMRFISDFKSVTLGTIDEKGDPFSSYAPFVPYDKRYYIFISDIARHARNLKKTPKASLFFVEDESKCDNIFARKRAVLQCESALLARESELFSEVMQVFKSRFDPNMLDMLLNMKDFNLYELRPTGGEAVFGFGAAYDIVGEFSDRLQARQGGGHAMPHDKNQK